MFSINKVLIVVFSLFVLTGCDFKWLNHPEDTYLYFDEERSVYVEPIDILSNNGHFKFSWKTNWPVAIFLADGANGMYHIHDSSKYKDQKVNLTRGHISGIKRASCEIDTSYIEVVCKDKDGKPLTEYRNISHLYESLPATLHLIASFKDEKGEYHFSRHELYLK